MSQLGNNGSGKTDWYGAFGTLIEKAYTGDVFEGLNVAAQSSPNMTVKVNPGTAKITTGSTPSKQSYLVRLDTSGGADVTITTANGSNPRRDLIVAYYDVAVIDASNPNNPGALKFAAVAGTPAASPADPNSTAIQTAVGASNPYIILARVLVGTGVTQITSGNVTDLRVLAGPVVPDGSIDGSKLTDGTVDSEKLNTTIAFRATHSTAQSTASNAFQAMAFDSEVYDYGANYAANEFTAPVAGLYIFIARAYTTSANSRFLLSLYKNTGSGYAEDSRGVDHAGSGGTSGQGSEVVAHIPLQVGDKVKVYSFGNTTLSMPGTPAELYFSGHLIGVN